MNLQQLRYVEMLAKLGSFVAAARACNVTQPTLSNGIAQIEEELGLKLFSRTTRKVNMTERGHQLLVGISDILNAQKSLVAKAIELREPSRQLIRIGVSPLVGMEMVDHIVSPFRRSNPNIEIVFRELNLVEMLRLLESSQLEFVFGPVDVAAKKHNNWNAVQFLVEPLVFLDAGKAAAPGSPVYLDDIAKDVFVMVPDSCGLTKVVRALFKRNRLILSEYAGAAMSYRVLQEWSDLGIGSAILPRSKTKAGTGTEIISRRGKDDRVMIAYEACWYKNKDATRAVQDLGTFIKTSASSLASGLQV